MLKKALSLLLVIALTATIAITGTVAYLQDDDGDVNVMTLGSVSIDQIEQERDANGNLVDFTQTKPAYPAVGEIDWADTGVNVNGTEYKVFDADLKNVVDKIVTVKNTGKSDAYVRTIIAIEAPDYDPDNLIHINYNTDVAISDPITVEIDGVEYVTFVFTYAEALKPGEVSAPSLMQVFLDSAATNEDVAKFGDTWEILVLSQAVQTAGFEGVTTFAARATADDVAAAHNALNTAFGVANEENVIEWFSGKEFEVPTVVSTQEELSAALAAGKGVILANDITLDAALSVADYADIDLNGKTLTTVGLDLEKGGKLENGTVASGGNTNMTPHLKISGGSVEMNNVTVDVKHHLNANVSWTEATGMEVVNATAVLNNCNVKIHNGTKARWVYSYGISLNNAELTMNGGSITATCVAGTAANGPTNPNAISTMGAVTATLNNVDVTATYYATTVNGHLIMNTTDKNITSANIVDNRGGSHELNHID